MFINHITYTVSDISQSVDFYNKLFRRQPCALGKNLAYYDIDGLWFALNKEEKEQNKSYQHIAFACEDIQGMMDYLDSQSLKYELGRKRHVNEGASIYIRDPDQNLLEFHSGSLQERLNYYKTRKDIEVL